MALEPSGERRGADAGQLSASSPKHNGPNRRSPTISAAERSPITSKAVAMPRCSPQLHAEESVPGMARYNDSIRAGHCNIAIPLAPPLCEHSVAGSLHSNGRPLVPLVVLMASPSLDGRKRTDTAAPGRRRVSALSELRRARRVGSRGTHGPLPVKSAGSISSGWPYCGSLPNPYSGGRRRASCGLVICAG